MMNTFLLRALTGHNALTPSDKIIIVRSVALDSNGQAVVDLSDIKIKSGAQIDYFLLSHAGAFPQRTAASTFGTASIAIGPGEVPVALAAVAASGDVPAVVIPAASKTVTAVFIINPFDLESM